MSVNSNLPSSLTYRNLYWINFTPTTKIVIDRTMSALPIRTPLFNEPSSDEKVKLFEKINLVTYVGLMHLTRFLGWLIQKSLIYERQKTVLYSSFTFKIIVPFNGTVRGMWNTMFEYFYLCGHSCLKALAVCQFESNALVKIYDCILNIEYFII